MGKLSDEEKMGVKAGMVVAGILSTFALRYVEPTRGVGKLAMVSHALFAVFAVFCCDVPGHARLGRHIVLDPGVS